MMTNWKTETEYILTKTRWNPNQINGRKLYKRIQNHLIIISILCSFYLIWWKKNEEKVENHPNIIELSIRFLTRQTIFLYNNYKAHNHNIKQIIISGSSSRWLEWVYMSKIMQRFPFYTSFWSFRNLFYSLWLLGRKGSRELYSNQMKKTRLT